MEQDLIEDTLIMNGNIIEPDVIKAPTTTIQTALPKVITPVETTKTVIEKKVAIAKLETAPTSTTYDIDLNLAGSNPTTNTATEPTTTNNNKIALGIGLAIIIIVLIALVVLKMKKKGK